MSVIRSAGLRGFRAVVEELGGDADDLARRARLDPAALDADDLLVPDLAMAGVLELAAHELDRPDLGLRVAARQDLSLLGPLALAIENSPTVAEAMECTSRYLFVHAPAMRISLEPDPDGVRGVEALRYDVTPPGVDPPRQGTDLSLGSLHRSIRSLAGGGYGLRTVDLPGRPVAPRAAYEDFFGARVRFGRPAALLRLPSSLGALPLAGRDESVRRMALDFLDRQAPVDGDRVAPRVRGAVDQLLGTASPEVGAVARLLDLHPRTLQRRLAAEGTTFAAILDDARRAAARRYLLTTDLPLAQVAGLLGLSEQAVLTRACRRWWDRTPRDVRRHGLDPAS
ncbi:AraC family transcriptional regulator [Nocardioides kribbensis]|uniref:AraC family transcriptional regulator n=1 Tax=Nocardioides kribbensis TaxID=305517 RepID=UPI0032DB7B22